MKNVQFSARTSPYFTMSQFQNMLFCEEVLTGLLEASRQTSSHFDFTIDLGGLGDLELAHWHRIPCDRHGVNCEIPEVVGVRIRKGGDETNVLCASCGFQGVGRLSFNTGEGSRQLGGSPLVDTTCAKLALSGNNLGTPYKAYPAYSSFKHWQQLTTYWNIATTILY